MKKDECRKRAEHFITRIYFTRYDTNEVLFAIPLIVAILFSIIGAPIIIVLCELSLLWSLILIFAPVGCTLFLYFARKWIVIKSFTKIKDVSDRIEVTDMKSDDFEAMVSGKVFMLEYSEYMKVILYNWFFSLNVTRDGKLKMYKVTYDDAALVYLGVCESDLDISEEAKAEYEKETFPCIQLSDMENGKVVNVLLYARLAKRQQILGK